MKCSTRLFLVLLALVVGVSSVRGMTFKDEHAAPIADPCLDLGRVEMIAGVRLNGVPVGTVWAAPYRVDVTRAVKPGANRLAVEVTGTWFNRLVYDAGRPEAERKTWTIKGPDKAAALQPAGLLGPVALRVGQRVDLAE